MSITALRSEVDQLRELCDQHQKIMVLGHKDADGDTLGCSLAFGEALRRQGRQVSIVMPQPLSQKYAWMPGFDQIAERPDEGVELVLFFDAGNMARSGSAVEHIAEHATIVNVDHHPSNSRFGDVNIIDPEASAVGQMCLDMLEHFGWEITPAMATNLYTALMTDTGGFRHENTTRRALRDAARLAALGADPSHVASMVYKSRPLTTLKLSALSLATMQVEMDGRLVWAKLTRKMLRDSGAAMSESEDIIDTLNSLAGLDLAIIFKEVQAKLTKISVRSRGAVDAAALCGQFGGGGHLRAAGAEVPLRLEDAIPTVLETAREAIEATGRR
ncbi:MAG TPA: bifunctional oligoribonuclease/PAP phosphatase NrnA [Candidatus Dormibacteraeota bacterium]